MRIPGDAAMKKCRIILFSLAALAFLSAAGDVAEMRERIARTHAVKAVDSFYGYDRVVFDFDGYEAWVVCPKVEPRKDRAWTWVMQWATAFVKRTNVPQMLAEGYHHVTIDTFRHRMDETGLKVSAAFQRYLVDELGFAKKANLIGMSWGGFFSTRYAANYPENVAKIYLDAPLLCFHEFKIGIGPWENRKPAGGWKTSPEMPVNMAERLAAARIPILLLYGGKDTTCVPSENCEPFAERFRAAGGEMESVCRGLYGHHPHGIETDETTIMDFFNRSRPEPLADFTGEPDWPFADGRCVSPVIDLRKPAGENAFYLLTFEAKSSAEGTWLFESLDETGAPVGEDRSALYATAAWRSYQIPVPVVPETTKARLAFEGTVRPAVRNVRIRKSNPGEAAGLVAGRNARFQQPLDTTVSPGVWAWARLSDAQTAIRVAKDFSIVYVGDEVMNDTWNGCVDAFVRQAFPDTRIRSHVAIAPDGGAAFFAEKGNFDRFVARHRPNLVVLGGVSNNRVQDGKVLSGETREDIRRFVAACRAIGAETAVCSPAKSADPRKLPDDSPLLASDDIHRAAKAAGAQFWDVTTAPVGTVRRCPDAIGWHNRGETLNNNRGKVLNALTMAAYFQAANLVPKPYVGAPDEAHGKATRRFTGIPSLERSPKNGRLWCTWYAGPTSNEDENNYIVLATSGDGGTAWREVLIADPDGRGDRRAFDPEVWIAPDGKLRWTWTERYGNAGDSAADDKVMCVELDAEDAPTGPCPQPRAILPGIMMCKPTVLSTGEWLYPVARWGAAPSSEFYATRDGRAFERRGGATLPEADRLYDEQMVLERTDGELVAFIRTKFNTRLSTSRDGGRTWSEPKESDTFGNFSTRLFVRRLKSGAVLLVKNGRTPTEPARGRAYLTAFLSRDDGRTWEGGLLLDDVAPAAYPDGAEGPDGLIRIVYDHDRHKGQEIFMATFTEDDVRSGRDVSGRCRLRQVVTSARRISSPE